MTTDRANAGPAFSQRSTRIVALALTAVCAAPLLLMLFGVDFASQKPLGIAADAPLSTESAFRILRGSFTHTLLEWTAFCAAIGVCVLAFVRYRITRDPAMPIIGMALACAGAMDAFHTLAADRLIQAVADNRDLIPFTWAICRLFNAMILLVGVGIFIGFERREGSKSKSSHFIGYTCAGFVIVAYGLITYCANSEDLPQTMFADALFKRPFDLAALVPFIACAVFVFPAYLRRSDSIFSRLLFLSLIPQIATQLYMAFGSSALFDSAFNIAHALKALAYLVPVAGLVLDHVWTFERAVKLSMDLEMSHGRTEAVMNAAAEGIIVIGPKGVIESSNVAADALFGYDRHELIGKNVSILAADPHREAHDGYLDRFVTASETRVTGMPREVVGIRQDGSEFPLKISVGHARVGGQSLFVGLLYDQTAEKALSTQLAQAQKLESIGQLAAGIAHEINTPTQYTTDNVRFLSEASHDLLEVIEAVHALIEVCDHTEDEIPAELALVKTKLEEADVDFLTEEIPRALEQSLEGLSSVASIVRAMKEFSHPGQTEKVEVDLNRSIGYTTTVARNEWRYVAELELLPDEGLPPVPCVGGAFNQVILNLVVNAAHAIAERLGPGSTDKGHITISTAMIGEWVEVRIKDDGCGMPESVRQRAFDPFFTTKEVGSGTGQGLAIAHSVVVDKHQGTIQIESEEGVGTEFIIRLPLNPESVDSAQPASAA